MKNLRGPTLPPPFHKSSKYSLITAELWNIVYKYIMGSYLEFTMKNFRGPTFPPPPFPLQEYNGFLLRIYYENFQRAHFAPPTHLEILEIFIK